MDSAIAERLAKLLRVICDRSIDGETLAAAGKLSALAAAHSVDWDQALTGSNGHDLTQSQMAELYEAGLREGLERGRSESRSNGDWASAGHSRTDEVGSRMGELALILTAAEQSISDGCLDGKLAQFASDMRDRLDRWGSRTFVSEKQWDYLGYLRSVLERSEYL